MSGYALGAIAAMFAIHVGPGSRVVKYWSFIGIAIVIFIYEAM